MGQTQIKGFTRCPGGSTQAVSGTNNSIAFAKKGLDADEICRFKLKTLERREKLAERHQRYIKGYAVPTSHLQKMKDDFVHELHLGLDLFRQVSPKTIDPKMCSFKMLDSHVRGIPTGEETGTFYAIDFGGTNFRAVRLMLHGGSKLEFSQYKSSLAEASSHPKGLMDAKASATEMFDFFAKSIKTFMQDNKDLDSGKTFSVGFTFSFPCEVRKIDSALLMEWTKDFETGRSTEDKVEHADVCDLLRAAFQRNQVPAIVAALMNDTVGTLLSCAYEMDHSKHPQCLVGIILGTGCNACYFDDKCQYNNYQGNIVNIECGNFNRSLPQCNVDMEIDFASANRGSQLIEKMISGAYLGELCRRTVLKVFQAISPQAAWESHSLSAEDASRIASDNSSDANVTSSIIKRVWNAELSEEHCHYICQISYSIFDRSAALAAVIICACAEKTGYLQAAMGGLSVGVDGSLYKCNKFYRTRVRIHMEEIVGKDLADLIHLVLADDGSGKGAGIAASQVGTIPVVTPNVKVSNFGN